MRDYYVDIGGSGRGNRFLKARKHPEQAQALLWTLPEDIGTGTFVTQSLSCNTSITLSDCYHTKAFSARLMGDCDYSLLVFSLRGSSHHQNNCFSQGFTLETDHNCLYASDDPLLVREIAAKEQTKTVVVGMPRSRLGYLLDKESYCFVNRSSLRMKSILDQIIHCRHQGRARQFFLESKALELIALKLEVVSEQQIPQDRLPARDFLAAMRVKEYLLQNLHMPSDMAHLCHIAGMSHPTLNKCFKKLFGCTVFAWFRQQRLLLSRDLVVANEMNLTAIAYSLGFANSSHFSREFYKYFGIQPSQYVSVFSEIQATR